MEKTTKELIEALSSGPVRQFLIDHESGDISKIIFKHKELLGIPTARLLEQLAARRKAKDKLPLYYKSPGVIYPPSKNLEQSSSEKTAVFKSQMLETLLVDHGDRGADLTGGFGVDSFFLSKKVGVLDYVETDFSLLEIARHNHKLLGAHNIHYHATTAEEFIRNTTESFDFIYIDPSRRPASGKKIKSLVESEPDVLTIAADIFAKTTTLLIKASPLLDIQAGLMKIPYVQRVIVISVDNECKEVLFVSRKDFAGTPSIVALNITDSSTQELEFTLDAERQITLVYGDPGKYLYEPHASILKAGGFKSVAKQFDLKKLHPSTHLYTANHLVETFPGRKFVIEAFVKPDRAELRKYFPDAKANVTTRNYPLSAEELKKKAGLNDGGEKFLIGFSGQNKKKHLVVAKRL